MDYVLLDVILLLIPFMVLQVYLSTKDDFSYQFFKSRFPLVLISYIFVLFVPVFVLIQMIHFDISDTIEFYLHEFHPNIIVEILTIDIDIFSMMLILWCISMIYTSLVISQLAIYFLNKELAQFEKSDIDIQNKLSKETIFILNKYNITIKVISIEKFGNFFSLSYFHGLKRKNIIYICEQNLNVLTNEELNAAIVHEIAHIKNQDTIYSPIFNTLSKFMFFEPIIQRIRKNYLRKIETRADLFAMNVIPNPKCLAEAILKTSVSFYKNSLLTRISEGDFHLSPKDSEKKFLVMRINRILNYKLH